MQISDQAPDYIRAIAPYQAGKPIADIARAYGFSEDQVIKLASNENPLGMSPKAREAMQRAAIDLGRYPDGNGFDLKAALVRRFGLDPQEITLGNGSNDILEMVAHAFLRPGTESVMSAHSFAVYALASQAVGAKLVVVPARTADLGHDLSAMAKAVTPATSVVWIANPNNPTGSFIPGSQVYDFIRSVPPSVLVVLDEAYTEYLPPEDRYPALDWVRSVPNLLVSRSFSKAYGLAGLRVGYGVANAQVTDLLNRVRQPFNVNTLAQAAAAAALFDEDFLTASYALNRAGLAQLNAGLAAFNIRCLPSWGNFLLADLSGLPTSSQRSGQGLFEALLVQGVITRPVQGYGLPQYLRISVGTEAENAALIAAIPKALEQLRTAA
ncbi:MAG: histidinol-phosphate aminotransferase [Pseudomonadota bacterium]|jgi:histidinol-phosphate aminotransferase